MSDSYEPGLTWRSVLGIVFSSAALLPVAMYLQLVSGTVAAPFMVYFTLILFSEFSRIFGSPLTKQELFIIYKLSGIAATALIGQVYRAYFVTSPITWSFKIDSTPIPKLIPSWWAPPPGSEAYRLRTIFHPDYFYPILYANLFTIFSFIMDFALTMILAPLYLRIERLPFPMALVEAEMCITLAERRPDRFRVFIVSSLGGMLYAFFVHFVSTALGFSLVPLPFWDLTSLTESYMPGALIGISTEAMTWVMGMVVPFPAAFYMLIGSLGIWIFGNTFTLTLFPQFFPLWVREYRPGMGISAIWQRSLLRVWIVPQIAFGFALAVVSIFKARKSIISTIATLRELRGYSAVLSPKILLGLYILGAVSSVLLFHYLVPDFPLWIPAILSLGFSAVNGLIATRALGETGTSLLLPDLWTLSVYFSGYKGVGAWLIQQGMLIGGYAVPGWVTNMKIAELTKTRWMDFFKALVIVYIVQRLFGWTYLVFFWSMSPIPSVMYPAAQIQWPIQAITQCVWMTRSIKLTQETFFYAFGVMLAILLVGETLISKFVPFLSAALITGTTLIPPYAIAMFMGSLIGRYVFPRILGHEWWRRYRVSVVAGFILGESIIVGVGVAGSLLARATWVWPW